jgi:hypothetical protein
MAPARSPEKSVARNFSSSLRHAAANRLGAALTIVNLFFFAIAILQRGGLERQFHAHYEPALLNLLLVINLPALLAAGAAYGWLTGAESDVELDGAPGLLLALFAVYLQWSLVGYWFRRSLESFKELGRPPRQAPKPPAK